MTKVYVVKRISSAEHGPYFSNPVEAIQYIKYQKGAKNLEVYDIYDVMRISGHIAATSTHSILERELYHYAPDADDKILLRATGLAKLTTGQKDALGL